MRDIMMLKRVVLFISMLGLLMGASLWADDFYVTEEISLPTGICVHFNKKVNMSTITPSSLYILGKEGNIERNVKLKRFGRGKKIYITFKDKFFVPVKPFILVLTPDIKSTEGQSLKDGLIMGRHFKTGVGCSFKDQISNSPRIVISKGAAWWIPWRWFPCWYPPEINITGIDAGGTHDSGTTAVVNLSDPNNDIVWGYSFIDFKPYTPGTPVTENGNHWLLTFAADKTLRGAVDFRNFKIEESSPPAIVSIDPSEDQLVKHTSFTIRGVVNNCAEVLVNGDKATLNGDNFIHNMSLTEGKNLISVEAKSPQGSDKASVTVTLDSTAPVVTLNSPAADYISGQSTVDIMGVVEDAMPGRVELHIGSEVTEGTLAGRYFRFNNASFSTEGTSGYKVVAYDKAGNRGEVNGTVTLDTTVPTVTINAPQTGFMTRQSGVVVRGSVNDNSVSKVSLNGRTLTLDNGEFLTTCNLTEGQNRLEVAAIDAAGNRGTKETIVTLDTRAPNLVVYTPQEGYSRTSTVTVSGSVDDPHFASLKVNGTSVTPQGKSFSLTGVNLEPGDNSIEVVATDSMGNRAVRTINLNFDGGSPEIVSTSPENSNAGVPVTDTVKVVISEEVDPVTVTPASLNLTDSTGNAVNAKFSVDGKNIELRPSEALKSAEKFTLNITQGIKDRAGNPLKAGRSIEFTTVDSSAPEAPVLGALPEKTFNNSVVVTGSAEAGTTIKVNGGQSTAETVVADSGKFTVEVELVTGKVNRLEATATDEQGNESAPTEALIRQDDSIFSVFDAELSGDTITVNFSASADISTLTADSIKIITPSGSETFTASAGVEENSVAIKASGNLEGMVVNLKVLTTVKDSASRSLSSEFTKTFNGAGGDNIVTGEVYDDVTGLLMEQAVVTPVRVNGSAPGTPTPTALSSKRGEFALTLSGGTAVLRIDKAGYLIAYRTVATAAGFGSCAFDTRLIADRGSESDIDSNGGTVKAGDSMVIVPGGAVNDSRKIRLSERGDQSLIARLPYGWSPAGAVDFIYSGDKITAKAVMRVPNRFSITDPSLLMLARYDETTFAWYAESMVSVSENGLEASVDKSGAYVFLIKDTAPVEVPVQEMGTALKGTAAPSMASAPQATLVFDPELIYPGTSSAGTLLLTTTERVPSGIGVTASISEEHELLSGTKTVPVPYKSDMIAYSYGNSQQKVVFPVSPDTSIKITELKLGEITTAITLYSPGDGGVVVGSEGGTVTGNGGVEVVIPKDALNVPVAVRIDKIESLNAVTAPQGFEITGGVNLALSGAVLAHSAELKLPLESSVLQGITAEDQLFIVRAEKSGDIAFLQLVTKAVKSSNGVASADAADLTVPLDGVRKGGTILFLRALGEMGYVKGVVTDKGTPLEGGLVSLDSHGIKSVSKSAGAYVNLATIGNSGAEALNVKSYDKGSAAVNLPSKDGIVNLNIDIQLTPPEISSMSPASGSAGVDESAVVEIIFSEPVDPVSLSSNNFYLVEGIKKLSGRINLDDTGLRATWTPKEAYGSDKEIAVVLSTGIRDMNGNNLQNPWNGNFRTVDRTPPEADPTKIAIGIPDDSGTSTVSGSAGAVDPGTVIAIYNPRTQETITVTAGSDGSFSGTIAATLNDRLLVTIKDPSGNVTEIGSLPFVSEDGKTAVLDESGGEFTTPEGMKIVLEPGTIDGPAKVTVEKLAAPAGETPDFLSMKGGLKVSFRGNLPKKMFKVSVPAPVSPPPGERYFLLQERELLGKPAYMLIDSASIKGDKLENNGNVLQDFGGTADVGAPIASSTSSGQRGVTELPENVVEYAFVPQTPGMPVNNDGTISNRTHNPFDPKRSWSGGYWLSAYNETLVALARCQITNPGAAAVADTVYVLGGNEYSFIPVRVRNDFTITVVDEDTGEELFKKSSDALSGPGVFNFGSFSNDKTAPTVEAVSGGLLSRLISVKPGEPKSGKLTVTVDKADDEHQLVNVKVVADAETALEANGKEPGVVRLYNGDTVKEVDANSDGSFSIDIQAKITDKLLLTVERGNVELKPQMILKFSEPLDSEWDEKNLPVKLYLKSKEDQDVRLKMDYAGSSNSVIITPVAALKEDESYTLDFTELKDLSGNKFKAKYNLRTRKSAKIYLGTEMKKIQATALNGTYLYVADSTLDETVSPAKYRNQLYVMDMSNPVEPKKIGEPIYVGGGPIKDMAFYGDKNNRKLVVVGGGNSSYGYLRLYDLTDPKKPVFTPGNSAIVSSGTIGGKHHEGYPLKVEVLGHHAYIPVLSSGMVVVKLDGERPEKIGFYYDDGIIDLKVYNHRGKDEEGNPVEKVMAVIANSYWGLRIVDVSQAGMLDGFEEKFTVGQLLAEKDPSLPERRLSIDSIEVATDYPVDLNENGKIEEDKGEKLNIVIFNSSRFQKLFVADITKPDKPYVLGSIELNENNEDTHVNNLTLDAEKQLLYAQGFDKGILGFNMSFKGRNFNYTREEKVVFEIDTGESANRGLLVDKELNLVYTGKPDKGLHVVRTGKPTVMFVKKDGDDYIEVERIAPDGTLKEDNPGDMPHKIYVMAILPGKVAEKVVAEVRSLTAEGANVIPFKKDDLRTFHDEIELKRVSDDPLSAKYKMFISDPVTVTRNTWDKSEGKRLLSGDIIECRLGKKFYQYLEDVHADYVYLSEEDCMESGDRKPAVRSDLSDRRDNFITSASVSTEYANSPANNPSVDGGVILHSGEAVEGMTDLRLRSRGLDFAFTRTYRSQVDYNGPLGRGWDHVYNSRLIQLMSGDIILFDGTGRRERFNNSGGSVYISPKGQCAVLKGRDNGYVLDRGDGTLEYYSLQGKLGKLVDKSGNKMFFFYNPDGQLEEVVDPMGRSVYFEYFPYPDENDPLKDLKSGRLKSVTGLGKEVVFDYNGDGDLARVDQYGRTHRYEYGGMYDGKRLLNGYIAPKGNRLRQITYGSAGAVTQQVLNGVTFRYSHGLNATVTDGNNNTVQYKHDDVKNGVMTEKTEAGYTTTFEYDGYNRLTKNEFPEGNGKIFAYLDRSSIVKSVSDYPDADRMADAKVTTYNYDGFTKKLKDVSNSNGYSKSYEYNSKGQLVKERDSNNMVKTMTYSPETAAGGTSINGALNGETGGFLSSSTTSYGEGPGTTTTYTTDQLGNVTGSSANGMNSGVTYNKYDEVISETTSAGGQSVVKNYDRDANGNVTKSMVEGGSISRTTTYTYNNNDIITGTTDDTGTTTYGYDSNANVTSVASPLVSATFGYDSRNLVSGVTNGANSFGFGYDGNYNPITSTNPRGKATTYQYNGFDEMKSVADPLGNSTLIQREEFGNLQTIKRTNSASQMIHESVRRYDPAGRLNNYTVKNPAGEDIEYSINYDDNTRTVTVTDPMGRTSTVEKDTRGRVVKETDFAGNVIEYTYDNRNNLTKKVETITGDKTYTTNYSYDSFNRLISEQNPEGNTAYFTYDAMGNLTGSVDFEGNSVSHDYDSKGRKIKTTRHLENGSINTDYGYYENGKLKTITDNKGRVTTYSYDDQQRLVSVRYHDGATKSYTYDPNGNVKTETKRDGTVITNSYDDADRLSGRSINLSGATGGTTSESYTYDGMNRIKTASNGDSTISRSYDAVGRLISETQNGKTVQFGYNKLNGVSSLTYPNGRVLTRTFDNLNRLKDIKDGGSLIAELIYKGKFGRYASKKYGNGDNVGYTYDNGRRMTDKIVTNSAGTVVNNYTYTYNNAGMRTSLIRKHEGNATDRFGYDKAYRLTSLVKSEGTDKEVSYKVKLGAVDNILELTTKKGDDTQKQIAEANGMNQYTQFGDWGYSYDQNGNVTTKGTQRFTYNYRNALIGYSDQNTSASYKFDVFGRRIAKITGGTTTNYYYAGNQVIEEYTGDALSKQYVYGNGIDEVFNLKIMSGDKAGTYYYHTDGIGSITAITDSNGDIVERVKYGIYGIPTVYDKDGNEIAESTIGNTYMFQGRRFDRESNTYHYRARSYDPTTGSFIQPDPLGYVDSMNLYQGMLLNPQNFVDPMGEKIIFEDKRALKLFIGLMTGLDSMRKNNPEDKQLIQFAAMVNQLQSSEVIFRIRKRRLVAWSGTSSEENMYKARGGLTSASEFEYNGETVRGINVDVFLGHTMFSEEGRLVHELVHAYQFLTGKLGFHRRKGENNWRPSYYDITDEVEAFKMQIKFSTARDMKQSDNLLKEIDGAGTVRDAADILKSSISSYSDLYDKGVSSKSASPNEKGKSIDNGRRMIIYKKIKDIIEYFRISQQQ